jgi:hypothetical protein
MSGPHTFPESLRASAKKQLSQSVNDLVSIKEITKKNCI